MPNGDEKKKTEPMGPWEYRFKKMGSPLKGIGEFPSKVTKAVSEAPHLLNPAAGVVTGGKKLYQIAKGITPESVKKKFKEYFGG